MSAIPTATAQSKFPLRKWMTMDSLLKPLLIGIVMHKKTDSEHVEFKLSNKYYAAQIDTLVARYKANGYDAGLHVSVGVAFRTISVIDGDWGDGTTRVECAKNWFGPEGFERFKQNDPEAYKHLQDLDKK